MGVPDLDAAGLQAEAEGAVELHGVLRVQEDPGPHEPLEVDPLHVEREPDVEGHAHVLLHPYDETPWREQVLAEPLARSPDADDGDGVAGDTIDLGTKYTLAKVPGVNGMNVRNATKESLVSSLVKVLTLPKDDDQEFIPLPVVRP